MDQDLQATLTAILYYLYRQAGCPYGDSLSGLTAWKRVNLDAPFNELAQKHLNSKN